MIEQLQKEVKALKRKASLEQDTKLQIELLKEYHKKASELLEIVHDVEKTRAGIRAIELIKQVDNLPKMPKYETGIRPFDMALGGIETGLFINLAGESGAGKTTFVLNLLANISKGREVVLFNFEMGRRLIVKKLKEMVLTPKQLNNFIIDNESIDLNELVREIELYCVDGVKFFAIDSKMKITINEHNGQEYQKISKISDTLSKLSARKDIVILLINQISEEDIKNKRLSFKGGGDQKYDSDIALFLVNEDGKRFLKCVKNRMNDRLFSIEIGINDYRSGEPEITEFR